MYEVIGYSGSRAFRILWMLEELGEPYKHSPEMPHSEMAKSVNLSGKIPVLVVDGETISDSSAILAYLADKHEKFTLSAGTIERAKQDALMHRILDELEGPLWMATRHSFVLPKEKRVAAVKPSLKWEFDKNLNQLASEFEGPFLMGEQFTFVDILFAHVLNWAYGAKFPITDKKILAYSTAMRSRDAFKRTKAL